eukprot:10738485-Lingulodinium_polyedra.AAC.1
MGGMENTLSHAGERLLRQSSSIKRRPMLEKGGQNGPLTATSVLRSKMFTLTWRTSPAMQPTHNVPLSSPTSTEQTAMPD